MTSNQQPGSSELITDYFQLQGHMLATASGDAYKSLDKVNHQLISVWVKRVPFPPNSPLRQRFIDRLNLIYQATPPLAPMTAYGIDGNGIGFAVLPPLDGKTMEEGRVEATEAERRFIACVRCVDRLHQSGVSCGDLSPSSFWIDRSGDVALVGVLGWHTEGVDPATVPAESLPYLAPEQFQGEMGSMATDVFALGAIGYHFFTKSYAYQVTQSNGGSAPGIPHFDPATIKPLAGFIDAPPHWADEVLARCLDPQPSRRPHSAEAILTLIKDIRERAHAATSVPLVTKSTSSTKKTQSSTTTGLAIRTSQAPAEKTPAPPPALISKRAKVLGAVLVVAVVLVLSAESFMKRRAVRAGDDIQLDPSLVPSGLGGDPRISDPHVSNDAKVQLLERLQASDDPLDHHTLVKTAVDAESKETRALVEKALIERARRMGLVRAAEQVRQWFRRIKDLPSYYETILKLLDPSLPMPDRESMLRGVYPSEPEMVLRLAGALALDTQQLPDYQPVMAQLVGDALKLEGADTYSTLALILAHPELALIFGDDIVQLRERLTNADISWVLPKLAERGDLNTRAIANLALERGILPPVRSVFLQIVRDLKDIPQPVMNALILGAGGGLKVEDLAQFGKWYHQDSEKVLLAVLADSNSEAVQLEAFDLLAGKNISNELGAGLMEWIRRGYWAERKRFAKMVGLLAFMDTVPEADIREAFKVFSPYINDGALLNLLMSSEKPILIKILLDQYGGSLELGRKLQLLRHSNREVRIAALKTISTNDIGALKIVSENYDSEKDPDIRKQYQQKFWFIKERGQAK